MVIIINMKNNILYLKLIIIIIIVLSSITTNSFYNNKYINKIEYNNLKEIDIKDIINIDKINEYNNKIKELLYLKYPKYISDVLIKEDITKTYLLRDNELVIYYSDYIIEPEVNETLYLTVNYNEIKDYLNFYVTLDNTYENESGYNYTNSKKSVAFTFDDSPNKNKTNKILNYLEDNHFHATFFIMGEKTINNLDLLINIKNTGNEIGSHTYNHKNMSKLSNNEIINDYNKMNNIYKSLYNTNLKYIRPPYGIIKKSQLNLIDTSFILWSLDTQDWKYRDKDYIVNYVINNIKDGDIILFHDSYDTTVEAIKELLPKLYSMNYQVMSVSELFNIKNINIENNKIYYNAY